MDLHGWVRGHVDGADTCGIMEEKKQIPEMARPLYGVSSTCLPGYEAI